MILAIGASTNLRSQDSTGATLYRLSRDPYCQMETGDALGALLTPQRFVYVNFRTDTAQFGSCIDHQSTSIAIEGVDLSLPRGVWFTGDTLLISSGDQLRLFSAEGSPLETRHTADMRCATRSGLLTESRFVNGATGEREVYSIGAIDRLDSVTDVASYPPPHLRTGSNKDRPQRQVDGKRISNLVLVQIPFDARTFFACGRSSLVVVNSDMDSMLVAGGGRSAPQWVGLPIRPESLTAAMRTAYFNEQSRFKGINARDWRYMMERLSYPPLASRFKSVVMDWQDRVWFERHPRDTDVSSEWIVVSLTGSVLGRVFLPRESTILGFAEGVIMLRQRTGQDQYRISLYRLDQS